MIGEGPTQKVIMRKKSEGSQGIRDSHRFLGVEWSRQSRVKSKHKSPKAGDVVRWKPDAGWAFL